MQSHGASVSCYLPTSFPKYRTFKFPAFSAAELYKLRPFISAGDEKNGLPPANPLPPSDLFHALEIGAKQQESGERRENPCVDFRVFT